MLDALKILGLILLVLAAIVGFKVYPDVRRYSRIERM